MHPLALALEREAVCSTGAACSGRPPLPRAGGVGLFGAPPPAFATCSHSAAAATAAVCAESEGEGEGEGAAEEVPAAQEDARQQYIADTMLFMLFKTLANVVSRHAVRRCACFRMGRSEPDVQAFQG